MSRTAVILVNFFGSADTVSCLDSLLRMNYDGELDLVIVDNNSNDNSFDVISSWLNRLTSSSEINQTNLNTVPKYRVSHGISANLNINVTISLLQNSENFGFAIANNIGIEYAKQKYSNDYFWILNNDTTVNRDALAKMVQKMRLDKNIGICGSTLLHFHQTDVVQAYGGVQYSAWSGRGWHIGAGEIFDTNETKRNNVVKKHRLDYVSGASMLISRSFLEEVGPMGDDYFLYYEELDWALRARGKFTLAVETSAIVHHKEGASIGTGSKNRRGSLISEFYLSKNRIRVTARYFPLFLPTVWFFSLSRFFRLLVQADFQRAWVVLSAMFGRKKPALSWSSKRSV